MNKHFFDYIQSSKLLASQHNINWYTPTDEFGNILDGYQWDLSEIANAPPTPKILLRYLGYDKKCLSNWTEDHRPIVEITALSDNWKDLIKAAIIKKVFLYRNKPAPIKTATVRPLMALAVAANGREPWEINSDDVRKTVANANDFAKSGKFGKDIISTARVIIDRNLLSNFCPTVAARQKSSQRQRESTSDVRQFLTDRKNQEKLPEEEAFWELVRIIWEEHPFSTFDHARFAVIKILVLCGMRISEAVTIPFECLKWIHNTTSSSLEKTPRQAIKHSLALRHFASKKRSQRRDSISLFEVIHHVPEMYNEQLSEVINNFKKYSHPMRQRLTRQHETGRIFPELDSEAILPIFSFYTRLTGEPFLYDDPEETNLIAEWKRTYNLNVLNEIEDRQKLFAQTKNLKNRVRQYFQMRLRIKGSDGYYERAPYVHSDGTPYSAEWLQYNRLYFRVNELEEFLNRCMPTKLSDNYSMTLRNGTHIFPHELLFLSPKRALSEERNGRICDIRKYAFIGALQTTDIINSLVRKKHTTHSLFNKYSKTPEKKELQIISHDFRHLQNTELFRLGISDTIITKRFNRSSISQSYEYDHRSLSEELKSISIPNAAQPYLFGESRETYRMIVAGLATGPVVDEFREIQKVNGDIAAFKFLSAEADGLHTTPYGHCINSFTVDPCPKHLECFAGCIHLTRSPILEHTKNLEQTKERLLKILESLENHPAPTGAKQKMEAQAKSRVLAIDKMLNTPVGEKVFPTGKDMSKILKSTFSGPFRGK